MSGPLRVVSYNLLHGMYLARRGTVDLPAAADIIAQLDADVVALQEVDRDQPRSGHVDQTARLADDLGMTGVFRAALHGSPDTSWTAAPTDAGDASGPAYGVALLSRLPISRVRRIALPGGGAGSRSPNASLRNPGWDYEPRVALSARVATPTAVEVVVTHLSYLPWRGVRQLRAALAGATGAPAVLVGDLNLPATGVNAIIRTTTGWRHAGGQPTFPAWRPRVQMHHVLVRGGVRVARAVVHPVSTSDHLPLVVDLVTEADEAAGGAGTE